MLKTGRSDLADRRTSGPVAHPKKFLTGFRGERCNQGKASHTGRPW